jgi:enamine deaminase RidA (YjgF/YER057c/UK114 family)
MSPKAVIPKELGPPLGMYSHGMRVPPGQIVVVAGQVGVDGRGELAGPGDVGAQTKQALENVRVILEAAGCTMRDVVRFQTFLTHATDIDGFMQARREVFPRYYPDEVYPPNTLLIVSRLVRPELLVEIEAMAVKPIPVPTGGGRGRPRPAKAKPPRRSARPASRARARR